MWRRAWVNGASQFGGRDPETYRLVQNAGTGMVIQGTREWANYRVSADVTPHMVEAAGIAARVQGLQISAPSGRLDAVVALMEQVR